MRRIPVIVSACLLAAIAAGCSSPAPGTPSPTTPSTSNSNRPDGQAVADPLDLSKLENDPCSGFTNDQLTPHMGAVQPGRKVTNGRTISCRWDPVDSHNASVALNLYPKSGGQAGMDAFSRVNSFYQRISPISSYPAAHANQLDDETGGCQTLVTVSNEDVIGIDSVNSNTKDPNYHKMCTGPDQLAQQLIGKLKSGG